MRDERLDDPFRLQVVEQSGGGGHQNRDLLGRRQRIELRLLQRFAHRAAAGQRLPGVLVQARAEAGKDFQFFELRIEQAQIAGDGAIGRQLRLAADARDGFADIHGGQDALLKQVGREIDLAVGDGDQVGGNVGRDVLLFGFDDGQRGERAAAQRLAQMRGALQQPRVDVENVAGKAFAAGRTAQQQREFAIGARVQAEVVEHDQRVAALAHEVFAHGHGGVGRDELQPGAAVAAGHHDDRVFAASRDSLQIGDDLGDR